MEKTFTISDHVQWTETDGEVILADLQSETIFGLDEVALAVWNSIAGGKTIGETACGVSAEYDAPYDQIQHDVEHFVQQMVDKGWLNERPVAMGHT